MTPSNESSIIDSHVDYTDLVISDRKSEDDLAAALDVLVEPMTPNPPVYAPKQTLSKMKNSFLSN